jgi:hypothetical protein
MRPDEISQRVRGSGETRVRETIRKTRATRHRHYPRNRPVGRTERPRIDPGAGRETTTGGGDRAARSAEGRDATKHPDERANDHAQHPRRDRRDPTSRRDLARTDRLRARQHARAGEQQYRRGDEQPARRAGR